MAAAFPRRACRYLNTQHIKKHKLSEADLSYGSVEPTEQLLEVGELGLDLWRRNMVAPLRHSLVSLLLEALSRDREGHCPQQRVVQGVIHSFVQVTFRASVRRSTVPGTGLWPVRLAFRRASKASGVGRHHQKTARHLWDVVGREGPHLRTRRTRRSGRVLGAVTVPVDSSRTADISLSRRAAGGGVQAEAASVLVPGDV